jgi:hypothetical protein
MVIDGKWKFLGMFALEVDAAICWNYHGAYYCPHLPLNEIPIEEYAHD